jgi:hypothetical protein
MTPAELAALRREYLHDLAEQARNPQNPPVPPSKAAGWVRDPGWVHKPSDDFQGCVE